MTHHPQSHHTRLRLARPARDPAAVLRANEGLP